MINKINSKTCCYKVQALKETYPNNYCKFECSEEHYNLCSMYKSLAQTQQPFRKGDLSVLVLRTEIYALN
jgi:hypothetical protein